MYVLYAYLILASFKHMTADGTSTTRGQLANGKEVVPTYILRRPSFSLPSSTDSGISTFSYSYIHHTPLLSNLICLGATTIALTLKCSYLYVITSYVSRINAYITQLVTLGTYIRTSPTCNLRNTYFECTCVTSYSIWLGSYSIQC